MGGAGRLFAVACGSWLWLSCSTASVAAQEPAGAAARASRDEFQALFAAGRYAEALPHAQRLVAAAESTAAGAPDVVASLTDLGITQLRLGSSRDAEASYMRALDALGSGEAVFSLRYVAPLAGLAAVYAAEGRHAEAVDFFGQAIAVSRRSLGLFSELQAPLIDSQIASLISLGRYDEAEAGHRYLVRITTRSFGEDDLRMIPSLQRLARWYEYRVDYLTARLVNAHIYDIARQESGDRSPAAVEALLDVGRCYRLHYITDPEGATRPYSAVDQVAITPMTGVPAKRKREFQFRGMGRTGRDALKRALGILESLDDPPPELLGRALMEIGDWHQTFSQADLARDYYSRAAASFAQAGGSASEPPLARPRLVAYRPPLGAIANRWLPPARVVIRRANFTLTVSETGKAVDVELQDTDMTSMQAFQFTQALANAAYSPRFENGAPVATEAIEFTGEWYEALAPAEPAPTAGTAVPGGR